MNDLYTDLSDGRLLIRLLEILSGEKIGPVGESAHRLFHATRIQSHLCCFALCMLGPGRGRLRINQIENVGKVLNFLQQKKVYFSHYPMSRVNSEAYIELSSSICNCNR